MSETKPWFGPGLTRFWLGECHRTDRPGWVYLHDSQPPHDERVGGPYSRERGEELVTLLNLGESTYQMVTQRQMPPPNDQRPTTEIEDAAFDLQLKIAFADLMEKMAGRITEKLAPLLLPRAQAEAEMIILSELTALPGEHDSEEGV